MRFVERAEAAGEGRDRAGLAQEGELAGEEVAEGDELRVVADDFVGVLLEGQHDVEAEAFFRARALLRRAHDAVARAGDGHEAGLGHEAGEFGRAGEGGGGRPRAGRAEDADFFARRDKARRRSAHSAARPWSA